MIVWPVSTVSDSPLWMSAQANKRQSHTPHHLPARREGLFDARAAIRVPARHRKSAGRPGVAQPWRVGRGGTLRGQLEPNAMGAQAEARSGQGCSRLTGSGRKKRPLRSAPSRRPAPASGASAGCRSSRRHREVVSQAAARQTLSVQQDLELPGPTTAAAPRQQPACTIPDRYHEGGALQAALWALGAAD